MNNNFLHTTFYSFTMPKFLSLGRRRYRCVKQCVCVCVCKVYLIVLMCQRQEGMCIACVGICGILRAQIGKVKDALFDSRSLDDLMGMWKPQIAFQETETFLVKINDMEKVSTQGPVGISELQSGARLLVLSRASLIF